MYLNKFSVRVNGKSEDSGYVEMKHGETYAIVLKNDNDVPCDALVEIDGKDMGGFRIEPHSNIHLERPANENGKFTFYQLGTSESKKVGLDKVDRNDMGLIKVIFKPGKKKENVVNIFHHIHVNNDWSKPWEPICPGVRRLNNYMDETIDSTVGWGNNTKFSLTIGQTYTTNTANTNYLSCSNVDCNTESSYSYHVDANAPNLCRSRGYEKPQAGGTGLSGHSDQRFVTVSDLDYDEDRITEINLRLVPVKEKREDPSELKPVSKATPVPPPLFILF